jgi:hypothetical protein
VIPRPSIRSTGVHRDTQCAPTWRANSQGSQPPAVNLYRLRVELRWLAQETTGFKLVRASEEYYPTSRVELSCSRARSACSRGYKLVGRGCRAQVP